MSITTHLNQTIANRLEKVHDLDRDRDYEIDHRLRPKVFHPTMTIKIKEEEKTVDLIQNLQHLKIKIVFVI
jgi:hypothetical protein